MGFISAKVLFRNEEFLACTKTALINSALVNNDPKVAWIYPNGYGYYEITFSDPAKPAALTGVWVTEGTQGMLLDGALSDVQAGLSSCCSSTPVVITPIYNGVFPPLVDPTAATYTYTRIDDGTIADLQDFALSYLKWLIPGTIQRSSYSGGVSTYAFQSLTDPTPQGNDVFVSESSRVFNSNVPAALVSGNKYSLVAYINGNLVGPKVSGTTDGALSTLVTALTADATYGPLGTWSTTGGLIRLTTTAVDDVNLTVTQAV